MSDSLFVDCLRTLQELERLPVAMDLATLVRITDLNTYEWLLKVGAFRFVNRKGDEVDFGRIQVLLDAERIDETGRALEDVSNQIASREYEIGLAREASMFGGAA